MYLRTVLLVAASLSRINATHNFKMEKLPQTMKAVGFYKHLPISDPASLQDVEVKVPNITNTDVLVEVKAISINPIDAKVRAPGPGKPEYEEVKILGWDGAGVVAAKGEAVRGFKVGDEVIFIGDIRKNGANAQYVALDHNLLASKPHNISFEEAAAIPLTAVTAYEALYDRMRLSPQDKGRILLIINSAGGVGSVASQLAKNLGLKVIGTASRPETEAFSKKFGADIVLNHTENLLTQLKENGYDEVDYIMVNYDPYPYWNVLMQAIKPQGTICVIVDCSEPVDIRPLKDKSVTLASEMMATRIKYNTPDKSRHQEILREISNLVEKGILKTTLTRTLTPINAKNLKETHKIMESKRMIGKLVLSSFN